ncbi:hypothetical protein ACFXJ8_26550 [Nonomuraea sp. NPDC059194]|uniref:hypothetical protein n=1 Tax=Nonomuraea sp. NPDC059194 TaxID=3346764 RepID=UPI0036B75CFD
MSYWIAFLQSRLDHARRNPDKGSMSAEMMIIIAAIVVVAIAVMGIVAAKIIAKANSIDLG